MLAFVSAPKLWAEQVSHRELSGRQGTVEFGTHWSLSGGEIRRGC